MFQINYKERLILNLHIKLVLFLLILIGILVIPIVVLSNVFAANAQSLGNTKIVSNSDALLSSVAASPKCGSATTLTKATFQNNPNPGYYCGNNNLCSETDSSYSCTNGGLSCTKDTGNGKYCGSNVCTGNQDSCSPDGKCTTSTSSECKTVSANAATNSICGAPMGNIANLCNGNQGVKGSGYINTCPGTNQSCDPNVIRNFIDAGYQIKVINEKCTNPTDPFSCSGNAIVNGANVTVRGSAKVGLNNSTYGTIDCNQYNYSTDVAPYNEKTSASTDSNGTTRVDGLNCFNAPFKDAGDPSKITTVSCPVGTAPDDGRFGGKGFNGNGGACIVETQPVCTNNHQDKNGKIVCKCITIPQSTPTPTPTATVTPPAPTATATPPAPTSTPVPTVTRTPVATTTPPEYTLTVNAKCIDNNNYDLNNNKYVTVRLYDNNQSNYRLDKSVPYTFTNLAQNTPFTLVPDQETIVLSNGATAQLMNMIHLNGVDQSLITVPYINYNPGYHLTIAPSRQGIVVEYLYKNCNVIIPPTTGKCTGLNVPNHTPNHLTRQMPSVSIQQTGDVSNGDLEHVYRPDNGYDYATGISPIFTGVLPSKYWVHYAVYTTDASGKKLNPTWSTFAVPMNFTTNPNNPNGNAFNLNFNATIPMKQAAYFDPHAYSYGYLITDSQSVPTIAAPQNSQDVSVDPCYTFVNVETPRPPVVTPTPTPTVVITTTVVPTTTVAPPTRTPVPTPTPTTVIPGKSAQCISVKQVVSQNAPDLCYSATGQFNNTNASKVRIYFNQNDKSQFGDYLFGDNKTGNVTSGPVCHFFDTPGNYNVTAQFYTSDNTPVSGNETSACLTSVQISVSPTPTTKVPQVLGVSTAPTATPTLLTNTGQNNTIYNILFGLSIFVIILFLRYKGRNKAKTNNFENTYLNYYTDNKANEISSEEENDNADPFDITGYNYSQNSNAIIQTSEPQIIEENTKPKGRLI